MSQNKNIFYLLDLLVDNDADSMLGYVVDTACLAVVAFMRHTFLNGTCALEVNSKRQRHKNNRRTQISPKQQSLPFSI